MNLTNYYPTRKELAKLTMAEKHILRVMGEFYSKKTPTTEYVKQDSLPQTLYFNCVRTMYQTLKYDPSPVVIVDRIWKDLKPALYGQHVTYVEENPRTTIIENYFPNREYERVLLFAGLYAMIKAVPFADNVTHLTLLSELADKACYNDVAEYYFQPFSELDVTEEIANARKEELEEAEVNFYFGEFSKIIHGLSNEDAYPYYVQELQRVKGRDDYPSKYVSFLETWINAMAKARTRDFKPAESKPSVAAELPEGTFTIDELSEVILENYKDDHKLVDKIETCLSQIYIRKQEFAKLPLLQNKIGILRSKMPERVQVKVVTENYGTQIANKPGGFVINVGSPEEMEMLQDFITKNKLLTSNG